MNKMSAKPMRERERERDLFANSSLHKYTESFIRVHTFGKNGYGQETPLKSLTTLARVPPG